MCIRVKFRHPFQLGRLLCATIAAALVGCAPARSTRIAGFIDARSQPEQQLVLRVAPEIRAWINASIDHDPARPTNFIFYALPNGNSIEQTLGCAPREGLDWHYSIQHVGPQIRRLRELLRDENFVLILLESDQRSWPAWRAAHADNARRIRDLVGDLPRLVPHDPLRRTITLAAHSGGGSFITGFINAADAIPLEVTRIVHLDSNYSYSDDDRHGEKLIAWLRASEANHLVVLAYDDREIVLDGKKVVGPTGGTWRATQRMIARFDADPNARTNVTRIRDFDAVRACAGRAHFLIHPNPENRILHTRLVGEMGGLLYALARGTRAESPCPAAYAASWQRLIPADTPRAYASRTLAIPGTEPTKTPPESTVLPGGRAFLASLAGLDFATREQRIESEILAGNVPPWLNSLVPVLIAGDDRAGRRRSILLHVAPDYLAVGRDEPVRIPMAPQTAWRIARALDCTLPTPRMVDAIHAAARLRLEPKPLTEARTELATFTQHSAMIDDQIAAARYFDADGVIPRSRPLGSVFIAGCKKDLVLTPRSREKPGRVAIYGWHYPDGRPIQPLSLVHVDTYVDYSHGVRLVAQSATLDGRPVRLDDLLADESVRVLLQDER